MSNDLVSNQIRCQVAVILAATGEVLTCESPSGRVLPSFSLARHDRACEQAQKSFRERWGMHIYLADVLWDDTAEDQTLWIAEPLEFAEASNLVAIPIDDLPGEGKSSDARNLTLSLDTLERLSRALRLGHSETRHLYQLAGYALPAAKPAQHGESLLPAIAHLLENMAPNPAYVLDGLWNVIAWNEGASDLFGDFASLPEHERNMVRLVFLDDRYRTLFRNWHDVANCVIRHFRSDSAANVSDPRWQALVGDLVNASAEFRAW